MFEIRTCPASLLAAVSPSRTTAPRTGARGPHPPERDRHAGPEELVVLPALDLGLVEEDRRAVPAHQLLGPLLVLLDRLPPEHGRGRAAAAASGEQEQQDEARRLHTSIDRPMAFPPARVRSASAETHQDGRFTSKT